MSDDVEYAQRNGKILHVFVEQDDCTGDAICTEVVPELFEMQMDGLSYVRPDIRSEVIGNPYDATSNIRGIVPVPKDKLEDVKYCADDDCPGSCILFLEMETPTIGLVPIERSQVLTPDQL